MAFGWNTLSRSFPNEGFGFFFKFIGFVLLWHQPTFRGDNILPPTVPQRRRIEMKPRFFEMKPGKSGMKFGSLDRKMSASIGRPCVSRTRKGDSQHKARSNGGGVSPSSPPTESSSTLSIYADERCYVSVTRRTSIGWDHRCRSILLWQLWSRRMNKCWRPMSWDGSGRRQRDGRVWSRSLNAAVWAAPSLRRWPELNIRRLRPGSKSGGDGEVAAALRLSGEKTKRLWQPPSAQPRWSREQIRAERLAPLAPLLQKRGVLLVEHSSDTYTSVPRTRLSASAVTGWSVS